ncbi:MFS transporter [Metarhizium robertsii]|uniref:Sugar transporter n=2 Tax=Metarhizium robertsii TaxID=568076 RepID=E9ES66_METRA|nr:sugar transporter [Metarhizium robertsii ARSEF 23]EFZ01583.1 sugar transporter [Metarhizium robertsii ARSEF 23]EXV01419.1 MFS transporter [Metarhizium robertsii]
MGYGATDADERSRGRDDEYNSSIDLSDDDAAIVPKGTLDPVYEAKARLLNRAIRDIGMGWYQWQLFIVVGFGWASDNLWPIVTSLILPAISNEFNVSRPPLFTLAQNIGLLAGAVFWGFGCDIFGRKWGFNLTLGLTAVWGMVAASAPNFAAAGVFAALWSFGVGGNLPVDSAIFLEFLPQSHQYLLTILSLDWALAQVIANLVAWPLLGNLTCDEKEKPCLRSRNMGWRYFVIAMGGLTLLMFLARFLLFTIHESPKYLIGKGRDEEAVRVIHEVAKRNGKTVTLTIEDLRACEPEGYVAQTDAAAAVKRHLEKVDAKKVKVLFATTRMALSTSIMMAIWALIGLAYPLYNAFLPYIQASKGAQFDDGSTYITYRNSLIISTLGVPGALLGGVLVELPRIGRKGTLSVFTALTGVFLYCSTTALNSTALLGWNCAFNFCSNVMYAVLYGYTPEVFPTPQRGTGNALTATSNRVFGIMAPIVAMFANLQTAAPVYTSGALFIAAGILVLLLPFESRGKAAL